MTERPVGIIGNFNADVILGPTPTPVWEREVLADAIEVRVAGTAGYFALALHSLGVEPRIVSALGAGRLSRMLVDDLAMRGVAVDGIAVVDGHPDPVTVALVGDNGRRALVTVVGAHERVDTALYERAADFLAPASELFICGTYLLPALGVEAARTVAMSARERGQTVIFDPSWDPGGWPEATRNGTLELLRHVDIFLPNEEELCALTGIDDWEDAAARLARTFRGELVVKRGPSGSAMFMDGELRTVPGVPIVPQDTTGAGDVFDAAYVWGRRQGLPVPIRLQFANTMAAMVVEQQHRMSYPAPDQVWARHDAYFGAPENGRGPAEAGNHR